MSGNQNELKGIRRYLWLAVGFVLLAAVLGSAVYIVVHIIARLIKCF